MEIPPPATAGDDGRVQTEMHDCLAERGVWDASGRRLQLDGSGRFTAVVGRVCDPEPLLATETALGRNAPQRIVAGLGAVGLLVGAHRLILAARADDAELLRRLRGEAGGTRVEVLPVPASCPLDATSLVCDLAQLAGSSVPGAGLDRALVLDAVELCDVAHALEGKAPLRRTVSVAGEVGEPTVFQVPLGTAFADLVEACGSPDPAWAVWHNGVLGGRRAGRDEVVDLDTRGLVVLSGRHPLVTRATTPVADQVARIRAACVACRICSDICPVVLRGGSLEPHRVMQAVALSWQGSALDPQAQILSALECLACGICNPLCPTMLRPAEVIGEVARQLRERGVGPAETGAPHLHPDRLGRRLSSTRLAEILGLGDGRPAMARSLIPDRIAVPLRGPTGGQRVPAVRPGERVMQGDLVTMAPAGTNEVDIRAPVSGMVLAVDPDDGVVIQVR
jgi:Na+-translocating ferredoxin:NAD+ oxidoreductase RnfC subunit